MRLKYMAAVAVRLFSIVLALYALRNGISYSSILFQEGETEASYIYGGLMVAIMVLCLVLWNFPMTVARGLVTFKTENDQNSEPVSFDQLLSVGLTILGIYFLFDVISDISYWVALLFLSSRANPGPISISLDQKALLFATAIEFIFVLALLIGRKRIAETLYRLKYGGTV